jgi:excisionase family DNA binding protein
MQRHTMMSNYYTTDVKDTRRRKLDDLFSNQPFLSPTMRANQLHTRLADEPASVFIPMMVQPGEDDIISRMRLARAAFEQTPFPDVYEEWPAAPLPRPTTPARPVTEAISIQVASKVREEIRSASEPGVLRMNLWIDTRTSPPAVKVSEAFSYEHDRDILTLSEAAELLRFSKSTVRAWAKSGRIASSRIGGRLRFRRQALMDWLTSQE